MKILIRKSVESDHPFIYATYIRNRWFDKSNKTTLKRATWSALTHKVLEDRLKGEPLLVACLDEDPDTILGYAFIDKDGPYSYVKLSFRAEGLKVKERLLKELL